jgi:hypothetical protein
VNNELVSALARDAVRQLAGGDTSSTRTVYAAVLALVAIGVALIFLGAWIVRQTKPDLELLAPLERMADRSWLHQDPAQKRRTLDEVRPAGAKPVVREKGVPEVDEDFAQAKPSIGNFDDLRAQQDAERRHAAAEDVEDVEDVDDVEAHQEGPANPDDE